MVQQVRYGVGEEVIGFPCGNKEIGETSLNGIIREIEEETGYKVNDNTKEIRFLYCNSLNPAFMTNKMSAYFIELRDDIKIGQHLDSDENIKVKLLTTEEVEEEMDKPTTSVMMRLAWEIYKRS